MSLTIYDSSAGSGKTYTLTKEYIKILLKSSSPRDFRKILAVTFTNKATAEMKERILTTLEKIMNGEEFQLKADLVKETGIDPVLLRSKCERLYKEILNNYSLFSISTIDSFFQKVIKSFTRELGLQGNFSVELDEKKVLNEVIDQMFEKSGSDPVLLEWLLDFVQQNLADGKKWDVKNDIIKLAPQILKEEFKTIQSVFFHQSNFKEKLREYQKDLFSLKTKFLEDLKIYGAKGLAVMAQHGLSTEDLGRKSQGVGGFFEALAECKNNALAEPGGWVLRIYNKVDPVMNEKTSMQHPGAEQELIAVLDETIEFYNSGVILYNSADQILKNLYTLGLLYDLNERLINYREENDCLLISDIPDLLKQISDDNDVPFIYEKFGNRYDHFLIDEFQDTSGFQWSNFKPLLINSLSEDKDNIIVGDVKQSIYRFRGGDWKLLLQQVKSDLEHFGLNETRLKENYRSFKNIIEFNNKFFRLSSQILSENFISQLPEQFKKIFGNSISNAYSKCDQDVPEQSKDTKGYISAVILKQNKDVGGADESTSHWKQRVLTRIPFMLEKLQDQGYQLKDIAILVRNNFDGVEIARAINEYKSTQIDSPYRYDVISAESLFYSESKAIRFIISFLKLLIDKDHNISIAECKHYYTGLFNKPVDTNYFVQVLETNKNALLGLSPLSLTENIIFLFNLNLSAEKGYLQSFIDSIFSQQENGRRTISDILEWWDEKGAKTSIKASEEQDAARIVTLHKSKGLQYPVVLVPFCNWDLAPDPKKNNIIWGENTIAPFDKLPFVPVRFSSSLKQTIYSKEYFSELMLSYMDNLNLLYVCFTRPIEKLMVFAPESPANAFNISTLLLQSIQKFDAVTVSDTDDETIFEIGSDDVKSGASKETGDELLLDTFYSFPLQQKTRFKSNVTVSLSNETIADNQFGSLVHEILSSINTPDEINHQLHHRLSSGFIDKALFDRLDQLFQNIFQSELMRLWYSPKWKSMNERYIVVPGSNTQRPDKVLYSDDATVIIDFKTGERSDEHQKQVAYYKDLLIEAGYTNVTGYIFYTSDLSVERI